MTGRTILITGATSGLGLAMARNFAKVEGWSLVLAVRDIDAGKAVCRQIGPSARAVHVDMSDINSVSELFSSWEEPICALVNNAGGQFHGATRFSAQGIEQTLALNVIGPLHLTFGLLKRLRGGIVLNIGSGTHNPHDKAARRFGFRGGLFTSIEELARGQIGNSSQRQAALDRYATSKLILMAATVELARRFAETRFINFDPGLMPGTGLVRSAPWAVRAGWNSILKWAVPLIPSASTPEKSAEVARELIKDRRFVSGRTYGTGSEIEQVWAKVIDPEFGRLVLEQCIELLRNEHARNAYRRP